MASNGQMQEVMPSTCTDTDTGAGDITRPSAAMAVDAELLRSIHRCQFVRRCAQRLLLDTTATATAILLIQQFYARRSESQFDARVLGGACIFLATKSCEVPRTLRSIVNVVHAIMNQTTVPLGANAAYTNLKNSLINAEQTVLRVLCFDMDIVLPHTYLFNYASYLNVRPSTTQCSLALVDDVLFAPEIVHVPPTAIAASCLVLAINIMEDPIAVQHAGEKWWYQFDASDDDIKSIASLLERIRDATMAAAASKQQEEKA